MSSYELRDCESEVLWSCIDAGALTTRTIIRLHGAKPNWSRLIDRHYLEPYDTTYGEVMALGDATRDLIERYYPEEFKKLPYLTGPYSVADRAYLQDALNTLISDGYSFFYHTFKGASPMVAKRRGPDNQRTSQVVSTCLRVPKDEAHLLQRRWGQRVKTMEEITDEDKFVPQLGYPTLYASISGGGLSPRRVRALYNSASKLSTDWRSPMLVVVPDLNLHRDVLRLVSAEQEALRRSDQDAEPSTHYGSYPVLRLIEQSRPRLAEKKSR